MQQTFKAEIDSLAVNKKDEVKITLVTDVANINLNKLQMIKAIGTTDVTLDNRQLELLSSESDSDLNPDVVSYQGDTPIDLLHPEDEDLEDD